VTAVKRPPTDFELLRAIYEQYRDDYIQGVGSRASKVLVPIDIPKISGEFGVDPDSVFGRLYYHLDPMYGQEKESTGARKVFFTPVAGTDRNCVNFPLLEAVLAGLWQRRRRDLWTLWVALVSLGIASGSLVVAIVTAITA
jgi:hypothetical protein